MKKSHMNNTCHHPRSDLARHYLTKLFDHGIPRLVLSGQPHTGKTAFVKHDIAQALEERGIAYLYCNLGQNKDHPQKAFASTLMNFLEVDVDTSNFTGSPNDGIEIHEDVVLPHQPQPASTSQLNQLLQIFDAWLCALDGKSCLILIDEIQHLATSSQFDAFAATLRTMLDTVPANIHVLFISSSPYHLNRLLNDSNAPFYQFAIVASFP